MGRKLAEATNASRMRRTRGEIGRLRRAWIDDAEGFLAVVEVPADVDFFAADFPCAAVLLACSRAFFSGLSDGFFGASLSGLSDVAGFAGCCAEGG